MYLAKFATCLALVSFVVSAGVAQETKTEDKKEEKKPTKVELGGGKFLLSVPSGFTKVKPKSRIVEAEFSVKALKGDENNGRLTMMRSGGSIEANIDRWVGQFSGKMEKEVTKEKHNGLTVHLVDLTGTFANSPNGPFGPKKMEDDYRMLGAICVSSTGNYFLKFYGPKKTVASQLDNFKKMLKSVKESE